MTEITHRQLWEVVADQLRDEILEGRIPAGTRLVETELAERFSVSRGPVRDALAELARVGLAEDLPRRGTFVSSLTDRDLSEVYVIRRGIEQVAVELAIARATRQDVVELMRILEHVESIYERGDLAAAWEADMAFHREYCRLSGNGRLLELFDQLASQTVLLMRTSLAGHAPVASTPPVDYHRKIANAIRDGDVAGATEAVAAHYRYTEDRLHQPDERASTSASASSPSA